MNNKLLTYERGITSDLLKIIFSKSNLKITKRWQFQMVFFIAALLLTKSTYAELPTGFVVNKLTGNVINEAVAMGHAPDGRIFIAERNGSLKVYQNGIVSTIHTVQTTTAVEQGLLGLTLHSDFSTNGKCYLYYTNTASTLHYLDLLIINPANQVTSVTRIMQFDPIINGFHNGGAMVFKNNHLYICIGESNSPATAVVLDTYMGKVLRLLEDGQPAPGNPYYNEAGASRQKRSIWAIGMRNPWYMSKDPITEKLYVINVGGNYEEINDVTSPDPTKNYNYGWAGDGKSGPDQPSTTIYPTYYYGHAGWGCAITSGVAFNPIGATSYPAQYKNKFYFTDWCSGWLRSFDMSNPSAPFAEFSNSDFGNVLGLSLGIDGNIYYFKYGTNGSLNRIEYTLPTIPGIVNQPISQSVIANDPVSFSVNVSGASPLTYQWQKNNINISGATAATYTISATTTADAGNYRCVVTNSFGTTTSNNATLTVQPFNARPIVDILTPSTSLTWNVLDQINFSGSATDPEDGTLPASAYQWEVRLYHSDCPTCAHWHPGPAVPSGVTSGSFIADNGGETSSNIWARLLLRVTDSQGRVGIDSVDLYPNKVTLTAATNKTSLQLALGGSAVAPFSKVQVVNSALTLSANSPQIIGDSSYTFVSWNIGGAATQTIRVPNINTTYTATYSASYIGQSPYGGVPHPVPGIVQAENFDLGGENLGYHDASVGNAGNAYRTTDNVDIENCSEGGFNIGYVDTGEWLEYTINVTQTASYNILLRVSTPNANRIAHLEINGVNISGSLSIPNTGGWQNWQNVIVPNVSLTAGAKVLRLAMDSDNFNTNSITFELSNVTPNTPPTTSITSPIGGTSFTAPASIAINANATDSDGTVNKVEFYNGTTKLGEDLTSPYSFSWTNVTVGNYTLTTVATDNSNASTTSAPISITVSNNTNINLALNKPVTVSSTENAGNIAAYAVDGIANTRWSSVFADPQSIIIDLQAQYTINRVKLNWENAFGKDFRIEVSNDGISNWSILREVFENSVMVNDYTTLSGTGRFIRVYGTARATGWGYSLYEIEVYGTPFTGGNQLPTISLTSPAINATFTAPASVTISATAQDADGSISKVEFYNGATKLGEDLTTPYSFTWTNVTAGNYTLTAVATDNQNATTTSSARTISVTTSGQSPYGGTAAVIPGKIEAEAYDLGGEGIAFHDLSTGNAGNAYRTDGVDIQGTGDIGSGYNIGWVQKDEWLEYTVNVLTSGVYSLNLRLASPNTGRLISIEMDGINISGTVTVPNTGGYQNWQTVTINNISLTAGTKVMRVLMMESSFNLNYISFTSGSSARIGTIEEEQTTEEQSINTVTAYPNPIENELIVKANTLLNKPFTILLTDLKGETKYAFTKISTVIVTEEKINTSSFPSGVYVLQIITEQSTSTVKVIK